MQMKNHFFWICCFGISSLQLLCGQTAEPETEVKGRRAWVVATTMPEDVANPLPVLSGEKLHMVRMRLRAIGRPIPVDGNGVVRAVKEETDADGKVIYKNLSISQIPEGVREALIVLVPDDQGSDGLRFRSKVVDLAKFKEGGFLYVNLVATKLGITIGDHKTVIAPGGMEFINPLENKDKDVLAVRFFYEVQTEGREEWKLMTSSKMAIYKSRREICIFYYNQELENVDFRGIPFMVPAPPKQPQQP